MRRNWSENLVIGIGLLVVAAILFLHELPTGTVTGRIADVYVKRVSDHDTYHVVVVKPDGGEEVFVNRDAALYVKFTSADVQQELRRAKERGLVCDLKVTGTRVPLFSWFRNIVSVTCVPAQ